MRAADYAKAAGLGLLLLALNLAIAFAAVFVYAQAIAPGHDSAYYASLAPTIAAWTAPTAGSLLFFAAGWLSAKRRPGRHPLAFIAASFAAYLLVDSVLGAMAGGFEQLLTLQMAASMTVALLGGLLGALLASRRAAGGASPA